MPSKWVKLQKLHELSIGELKDRAAELKASLFGSRFQRTSGKLENFRVLRQTKRQLAAVLTIMREKEIEVLAKEANG